MSEKATAVALFFDDAELGGHLRTALSEYGARIAHEGPLGSFDEKALRNAGVDVLVVNLDEAVDEDALNRIDGLVKSGQMPVVFNDGQASRGLDGWDRARWARHLAAKALNTDTIDPPRPDNAREIVAPYVEPEPSADAVTVDNISENFVADPVDEAPLLHDDSAPDSETLAAELEALLASDESIDSQSIDPPEEEAGAGLTFHADDISSSLDDIDFSEHEAAAENVPKSALTEFDDNLGSGLKFSADDELPPLHDGNFGEHDAQLQSPSSEPAPVEKARFNIDHLSLADEEDVTPPEIVKATLAQQTPAPDAPEWGFVAEDDYAQPVKKDFGVEKVSAEDYLAPDAEDDSGAPQIKPGLSLELVSNEEALAPPPNYEPVVAHETHLHELDVAFARLLVLGAARESEASLHAFLATLPNDLKLPILLTQHQTQGSAEQLAQSLAERSALPVKIAASGVRARLGEILLVPRGQQVRVMRDGRVELTAANDVSEQSPSIDSSFTMAANVFGRDVLAILFAGKATDAVAGAQAIHDRGGQVWVESSANDHSSDMVHGVLAERLASFSGSPQELAVRLVEDFR